VLGRKVCALRACDPLFAMLRIWHPATPMSQKRDMGRPSLLVAEVQLGIIGDLDRPVVSVCSPVRSTGTFQRSYCTNALTRVFLEDTSRAPKVILRSAGG